ncbi:hypothetical protein Plec18167_007445 [Paecilomyces lecythidis]|uniref:Cytochrome P450 n=1 Tax=Paecilomyces lecythidis TaxID=3004212 RepID=A0ABR3X3I9_9EURO
MIELLVYHPVQFGASALFGSILYIFLTTWVTNRKKRVDVPIVGPPPGQDSKKGITNVDTKELIRRGCKNYPDQVFQIWNREGHYVLYPMSLAEEVKDLPDDVVNSAQATLEIFYPKYTQLGVDEELITSVRRFLNQNLAKSMAAIVEEAEKGLKEEITVGTEWTEVLIYAKLARVIALISGRLFVGTELSRDEDWIATEIYHTLEVNRGADAIRRYHPLLRPIMQYFVPELRAIFNRHALAMEKVTRLTKAKNQQDMLRKGSSPSERRVLFDMYRDLLGEDKWSNFRRQADTNLTLSLVSLHTTGGTLVKTIYELASHPEYQQPLREEAEAVLSHHNGTFTKESLSGLKKLDSFIKETHRLTPGNLMTMRRLALKDFTLSDGTHIPKGTVIAMPLYETCHDPELYPDPETFDGFRFYNLRQEVDNTNRLQYTSTASDYPIFGHGKHACPGRFFATAEIKVIIATILRDYDLAIDEKPKVMCVGSVVVQDQTRPIKMRRRT